MKALVSLILAVGLVGGVYIATTSGCGARAQVAGKKIMDSIDKMIGELDIKRQKIENKKKTLNDVMDKVRKQKVASGVQLKQYQEKMEGVQKQIDRLKQAVAAIRPAMNTEGDQEINGTTYTQAELTEMATQLADEYDTLNKKQGSYENSVAQFKDSFELLSNQYDSAVETMKSMDEKIKEIDIKKESLDAMKTNQKILGESGSISDQFIDLRKEIDSTLADIDTELAIEKEKMDERDRDMTSMTKSVDKVLKDLQSTDEAKSRLDAIMGSEGGE